MEWQDLENAFEKMEIDDDLYCTQTPSTIYSENKSFKLRKNWFRSTYNESKYSVRRLCRVNAHIHSLMHTHYHLKNLANYEDNTFIQMVQNMIDNGYEEGKKFLLSYVINHNLHTLPGALRIEDGWKILDCMDYDKFEVKFLDKLKLPPNQGLMCRSCRMMNLNENRKRMVMHFENGDDMRLKLNERFEKLVVENSCGHAPEFPDILNIEIKSSDIEIDQIPQEIYYAGEKFKISTVICNDFKRHYFCYAWSLNGEI